MRQVDRDPELRRDVNSLEGRERFPVIREHDVGAIASSASWTAARSASVGKSNASGGSTHGAAGRASSWRDPSVRRPPGEDGRDGRAETHDGLDALLQRRNRSDRRTAARGARRPRPRGPASGGTRRPSSSSASRRPAVGFGDGVPEYDCNLHRLSRAYVRASVDPSGEVGAVALRRELAREAVGLGLAVVDPVDAIEMVTQQRDELPLREVERVERVPRLAPDLAAEDRDAARAQRRLSFASASCTSNVCVNVWNTKIASYGSPSSHGPEKSPWMFPS